MKSETKGIFFNIRRWPKALILLAVVVAAGCVVPRQRVVVNETPPAVAQRVTSQFPSSLYRLAAGDILEFLYLTIPAATGQPYRLAPQDQIDIEFVFHPEMNRTLRIRPDGKVSVPRKGDGFSGARR